jgi:putative lipoic acid-binding regulatory protein
MTLQKNENQIQIYPCKFPLKAVGLNEDGFFEMVVETVSRHIPGLEGYHFSSRYSNQDKYISVSVTFIAESREQVDSLYLEMSENKKILMIL